MPICQEQKILKSIFIGSSIITAFPGTSATDIEKRITDPLEDAIRSTVKDIIFTNSTSREGVSVILIRFEMIEKVNLINS